MGPRVQVRPSQGCSRAVSSFCRARPTPMQKPAVLARMTSIVLSRKRFFAAVFREREALSRGRGARAVRESPPDGGCCLASGRVRLRGTAPSAHTVLSTRSIYGKGAGPVAGASVIARGIQDACLWGRGRQGKARPAGGGWLPGWRGDEEGCPGRQRKARGREDRNSPSSVLCGARDAVSGF